MVHNHQERLDRSFGALADPTRRGVLERLARDDASITALAEQFGMSLTGMRKHVSVLEEAGFVATRKAGRVRTCTLGHRHLQQEAAWIERYRQLWDARFNALDKLLETSILKENDDGRTDDA